MFLFQQAAASTTTLFSMSDLLLIAPAVILTLCASVVLVMEVILPYRQTKLCAYFALSAIGLSLISLAVLWRNSAPILPLDGFYGMVRIDGLALFFQMIFLLGAALTVMISLRYLDVEAEQRGEYYALVLFAAVGMMMLACGNDLIILFISLELMAVTFYVLVAFTKRERKSNEAAIKYFLLGAFSSGILLYGMSLLFGLTGSTNIIQIGDGIKAALSTQPGLEQTTGRIAALLRPLALIGMLMTAAGILFKISAVPFHMWAPDAYEGAPTPVTGFLSTGSKAAALVLAARIFVVALAGLRADWTPLLAIVAAITIFLGNWGAVTQNSAKRLLAYSSVANAGYLLLGFVAGNAYGYTGLAVYSFVYLLMNIGAFGVIAALRQRGAGDTEVDDLTGLGQRSPLLALMMAVFMLSLGGLPATGGFIGKYFLFGGLIGRGATEGKSWYYWLAGWATLNTVVSFYYYIRFIRAMYLTERGADTSPLTLSPWLKIALSIAVIGVIFTGIYPQPIINMAQMVISALLAPSDAVAFLCVPL